MIDAGFCVVMARYNAWQNNQLLDCLEPMSPAELTRDRGAFFGSILGTLNHLLWGDQLWMSRFDGGPGPDVGIPESVNTHPTLASWSADRFRTDGRIRLWAEGLDTLDLTGELSWYSRAVAAQVTQPKALCVQHFFNHQTHHRGQVHAMITATGRKAPVSDLAFMPEET